MILNVKLKISLFGVATKIFNRKFWKTIFKQKKVVCVPKMGTGVDLYNEKGIKHPTTLVLMNGYFKLISQK